MAQIDELKQKANLVANATQVGENTAQRVGGALQDAAALIADLLSRMTNRENTDNVQTGNIESLQTQGNSLSERIDGLQQQLNTLVGADASDTIENFNEIVAFLNGITDDETLTNLLTEVNNRLQQLEVAVGKNEAYVKLTTERGYLDGNGEEIEAQSGETSDGAGTTVYTDQMRTGLIKLIAGSYRIVNNSVNNFAVFKYYNGTFVESVSVTTPYEFSVIDESQALPVGFKRFNQIRIAYTVNGGQYIGRASGVYLYGSVSSLLALLDDSKANIEELALLASKVTEMLNAKGVAGGVVPLNYATQIDAKYLPDDVYDVRMCSVWSTSVVDGNPSGTGTTSYGFNPETGVLCKSVFVAKTTTDGTQVRGWYWQAEALDANRIYVNTENNVPYRWKGTEMVPIAPENVPASIFNATIQVPINGFYVLADNENPGISAIHAAWAANKAVGGLMLSFELSAGVWKTYQYIGKTVTEANWLNPDNWKDFGSLAAGSEPYIIIDALVGTPEVGTYYTLETAVQALLKYQQTSGVTYAKKGLIISYGIAENQMETKQFQGEVGNFGTVELWRDFGGSKGETKDTPEEGGKDAFSTGGAYEQLPTEIDVNTETQGVVKLQLKNAKGNAIGEEKQFNVGTGTGGGTATLVNIFARENPLYRNAGGSFVLECAVQSITQSGSNELHNNIERVEIVDRDTAQVLETLTFNQASSASPTDFGFRIDVSAYFTEAGQRRLRLVAYDDAGNSGSRNINVVAIDVTITSAQTLNYTATTALQVDGTAKSLMMYEFKNNASDKGIFVTVECYIGNKWQTLANATINDTFIHSVTIDPKNVLGTRLTHGALPLRIHGEDIGSRVNGVVGTGVVGNYLYTAVMVVGSESSPIVVARWYADGEQGTKRLFETVAVDFAVYDPANNAPTATVYLEDGAEKSVTAYRSQTYTFTKKVTGVAAIDGSQKWHINVKSGTASSYEAIFVIKGTLLNVADFTTQQQFDIDLTERANSESDHTIADNGVTLEVSGVNWDTTGFVRDNYGTQASEGVTALRIAEDATGVLHYAPFADEALETNGTAFQITLMKKNIADDAHKLVSCINNGFGFYVDGKNIVLTFDGGATIAHTITAALQDGERTNIAVVIEPVSQSPKGFNGSIGIAKMYFDGEEVGACYYDAGTIVPHSTEVTFSGEQGDLYVYNCKAWQTFFAFEQAFNNYLLQMSDTDAMITEFQFNEVMASQTAEGNTRNRPQARALYALGLPYFVLCKNADTADNDAKDNYPEYLETLDGDKKTKRTLDVYAYFPDRPWQDFKAIGVTVTNQGTTSSRRPIKNIKMKFEGATVTLLHTESDFAGADKERFAECKANAEQCRVQVYDNSKPTNIITVKVDYSESGGANNGASTHLFNDLQRALGANYRTPAQNAYTGKYVLNTSIDSRPCAFFRTDRFSPDATSPLHGYFHAKGNWNCDKGDASFYGFEQCEGYNADCLNYGDFVELVAERNQTLTAFAASIDKAGWDTNAVYVLSEFCGAAHKVYRYKNGAWVETTGTMEYKNGKWVVTGDVVNPVENYELKKYDALDWFQGVNTPDDMLTLDSDGVPVWLQYFESRYPDNKALEDLYTKGKKLPYRLYAWLRFCQDCNQHLTAADGNITLGGESVTGDPANRLKKWKQELHTIANVHSVLCYTVYTDYIAAVDQRSKNMMIGFYLDTDGVVRMYLNHLYDGDTILGSDNDCGLTIPALLDPNDDEGGLYQGHDSVLFVQTANVGNDGFWLNDTGSNTVTIREVAQAMRTQDVGNGLIGFSYAGLVKYWVTDRLQKFPKLVSSYDGERKYIEHSTTTANYLYALHGLSIQRLKDFIRTRFAFRDGFYQCGELFSSSVGFRATGTNIEIKIKAAKDGYFAVGVDRANAATDSTYLKAGESYTLKTGATNTGSGVMIYVFGADKLEMLDISGCTPSAQAVDFSQLVLVKKFIVGGADYTLANNQQGAISTLPLGNLPFLEELDIRNTAITTVDLTYCPRLKTLLAAGSKLQRADLAVAAKVTRLQLPATYSWLQLRHLPLLENSGLTLEDNKSLERIVVEDCAKFDGIKLLNETLSYTGNSLRYVRIPDVQRSGDGTEVETWYNAQLQGVDATLTGVTAYPAITGVYRLTTFTEDETLAKWREHFKELTIKQQAYTDYKENDLESDPENVTNMDNGTGYDAGTTYVPSGHVMRIYRKSVPVKGKLNKQTGKMHLTKISETNYKQLPDGSAFDNTDALGEGYDVFMYYPRFWYKGINDFIHQEKHTLLSSSYEKPEDTWTRKTGGALSTLLYADNKGLSVGKLTVGEAFDEDTALVSLASVAVYRLDVEGCKQARYIGMNNGSYGSCFVDGSGKVLQVDVLQIAGTSDSPLDFKNENGDYIFRDVPTGAKWLYFTCLRDVPDTECFGVDSDDLEAIETGWVEHRAELIAVYGLTLDDLGQARSISGRRTRTGTGSSVTSSEWQYDEEGNPTEAPVTAINYTGQDIYNLCQMRGAGYYDVGYEQNKIIAILSKCMTGNRDDQLVYGFGCSSQYTTGQRDNIGKADSTNTGSSIPNKVWGLEGWIACNWEFMDNVGVNIPTFAQWKKDRRVDNIVAYPIDAKWHIYDPVTKTERVVQGITNSNTCIARLKHGRYCDIIPSSCNSDGSKFNKCYAAGNYYTASRGRVVGRASSSAHAYGGCVYAVAGSGSAYSNTYFGGRLSFCGKFENENEINDEAENA